MSDGTRLRQAWSDALGAAETSFRQLLSSYNSGDWKHVSLPAETTALSKGKSRVSPGPELTDVVVHRKTTKSSGENVYRVVLDVPATDESAFLDAWRAVLTTPELRQEWDPAVEGAHLVEMFDRRTRIAKTQFTLGWPANPRDAVTISRLHQDASTVLDVTTSLPRSADEPAYVRPSPPYVRSHVELFAWCIQYVQPSSISTSPSDTLRKRLSSALPRLRISCFCQHDFRAVWNFGSTATICQQLCTMMLGLYKTVKKRGSKVPVVAGYGYSVSVERIRFQLDRQALTTDYLVHLEEDIGDDSNNTQNLDELHERKRLTRSIEFLLPASEGWDVQVTTKAPSENVEKLPWTATAIRGKPASSMPVGLVKPLELTVFRIVHSSLPDAHSVLKVRVVVELSGPSSGIRLNGLPQTIEAVEERDPGSFSTLQQQLLQDASSIADASFQTSSSVSSVGTIGSSASPIRPHLIKDVGERSVTVEKSILSRVKRSYIYFSSLLQEPEAKWKRTTETRGVSVTQLDSIDPTLVVYRAEATFVGLGLWDLYGALVSPGARTFWDKQHDDAVLLEDVNELTELWHLKTKPAWPVFGRDTVLLKTVYKSPTTIHVFSFSVDDPYIFPTLPPSDPNFIRAQVDLQGWAIEALSPSTTQLTLLEQSDPKGWSNKASIPAQMVSAVAGVGDFVIKCGGPPIVTRLAGARALEMRYDHEKGLFRVAYEGSEGRKGRLNGVNGASGTMACGSADAGAVTNGEEGATSNNTSAPTTTDVNAIECEIRCDLDTWASSLDIVIDPPPQSVTALRRHRLSSLGGGLWLTFTHDALFPPDERLLAIVRRGPMSSARDKGVVMVNGARIIVDVEELPETEIKALSKRKRIKPARVPLDQPPVVGVIRRRRAEWDADGAALSDSARESTVNSAESSKPLTPEPPEPKVLSSPSNGLANASSWLSAPRFPSPLANFWSTAVEQATSTTQNAVAAITPTSGAGTPEAALPSASRPPMQHVAEALHWLRELRTRPEEGWTVVSENGVTVKRKLFPEISSLVPVYKGEKVIEGVSAEEVLSVVSSYACRKTWDDRFGSAVILEQFGAKCHTAFVTSKGGFPFRDRGFLVANVSGRSKLPQPVGSVGEVGVGSPTGEPGLSQDTRVVLFCVTASFHPQSAASFSAAKYNPYTYPLGRVFIDGWVLETLDPYTKENYAIPSTRVIRVVAVDHAGNIPVTVNSMMNAGLARSVVAVEAYIKSMSPPPLVRLPAAGLFLSEPKASNTTVEATVPVGLSGWSATWRVKRRDEQRTLVASQYVPTERAYNVSVILMPTGSLSTSNSRVDESPSIPRTSKIIAGNVPDGRSSGRAEFTSPSSKSDHRRESSASVRRSPSCERVRSTSSAFTVKGELKHSTDLIVAEVVVDTKLYPEGYDVRITSAVREGSKWISLAPSDSGSEPLTNASTLPVSTSVYTVPASPLHSSGLNTDRPPRHLLRLMLPTAQYQISTVQDPLTGATHGTLSKPQWYLDLQDKGYIVQVNIRPLGDTSLDGRKTVAMNGIKRSDGAVCVKVDGVAVGVASEKESLTALGRDELQDDRVSRMLVLQRCADQEEAFPKEFMVPIGRADHMLEESTTVLAPDESSDPKVQEESGPQREALDQSPFADHSEKGNGTQPSTPTTTTGGLFGFLNSYPNPLARWTISMSTKGSSQTQPPSLASSRRSSGTVPKVPGGLVEDKTPTPEVVAGTLSTSTTMKPTQPCSRMYPLSILVIVALIAFLIGSLLRSLLSPADFIYVVTDLRDAEGVNTQAGWREIRRLLEVKYIVGGWDFQIAVVRRH